MGSGTPNEFAARSGFISSPEGSGFGSVALERVQMRVFDVLLRVSTEKWMLTEQSLFIAETDYAAYAVCQWLLLRRTSLGLAPREIGRIRGP
jgi:hypothetical protein